MSEPRYFQVLTTVDSVDAARAIADAVLDARLAACVQVVGQVESHYWWKGRKDKAQEWLCIVKTTESALDRLLVKLREVHTYDVPELTATEIVAGDQAYLSWISNEVLTSDRQDGTD